MEDLARYEVPMLRAVLLILALATIAVVSAGCTPTTSQNLFNTGRDARVYNPATGRYEWPDR